MACGVPVVGSAVGGLAETVLDGRTGILVPPRQPRSIRAAIRTLMGDSARRRAMQNAAVRRAGAYAWPAIAGKTLRVAQRLALTRHTPAELPLSIAEWTGASRGTQ
jgi:glycosyltransferase involved in cell wall biosynthesis